MLLINEERKWFLEIESPSDEDAEKTVEMTTKDLEYYINLVVKAVAGLERTDSNFKRGSTVDKMLSNSTVCYREMVCERKTPSMRQTSFLSYFKKLPPAKRLQLAKGSDNSIFLAIMFVCYFLVYEIGFF